MKKNIVHIALVGNPNSGKSSLFNSLTGLNQKVGNFPGVTVDKKTGIAQLAQGPMANIGWAYGWLAIFLVDGVHKRHLRDMFRQGWDAFVIVIG